MKKILILVILTVIASASPAEDFTAWNPNDMIHPQLKEYFLRAPEMNSQLRLSMPREGLLKSIRNLFRKMTL